MGRHSVKNNRVSTGTKIAVSSIAIASVGAALAPAAQAAPDRDWDRLAQCESGGNWGINTGNGFQGGLQFAPSTWRAFGGGKYAASASNASREEQIIIAEKVLAAQGWGAWPGCSAKLGLSSAPTPRNETPQPAPAPAPAPAPVAPQQAVEDLAHASNLRDLDATYQVIVDRLAEFGIVVPPMVHDFYQAHRAELASAYAANRDALNFALGLAK